MDSHNLGLHIQDQIYVEAVRRVRPDLEEAMGEAASESDEENEEAVILSHRQGFRRLSLQSRTDLQG